MNEATSWIGYSLDGQTNVTIAGNMTLTGLTYGGHSIMLFANDTSGCMGCSDIINFTRENYCLGIGVSELNPSVTVFAGISKIFHVIRIFNINEFPVELACWWVQRAGNTTLPAIVVPETIILAAGESWEVCLSVNATEVGFFNGTVEFEGGPYYDRDFPGGCGGSGPARITVVPATPTITIVSPQNMTYGSNSIPLTFVLEEPTSWVGFSMDNQANVTVSGNTTLTGLLDGPHQIILYANNDAGNMGSSKTVYFFITPLVVSISPSVASIYTDQSVTFTLTASGGTPPYSCQWYVNSSPVSGATSDNWTFALKHIGNYSVYLNVTDSMGKATKSNQASVTVLHFVGDVNNDEKVDVKDVAVVAAAFGTVSGNSRWSPIADVNQDGKVDVKDVALVARDFGQHYP